MNLVRKVSSFAEENGGLVPPRPGQLVLLFVRDGGFEVLLDTFGLSTFAVPLDVADWHWPKGKHWRSDPDAVGELVRATLNDFERGRLLDFRLRMERQSSDDPLLLPARNFRMPDSTSLFPRLRGAHAEGALLDLDVADITIDTFTGTDLPTFFRKTGEVRKEFCVDRRGLVFATSRRGQHGPARVINSGELTGLADFRQLLEGCYRFGTPLREGFQHDVQWRKDRNLENEVFMNIDNEVAVTGSHANIFANDRVR
ncbi:hypothetical protein [Mesorhizobium sp. B2-4-17]|uniref:hypothetical protein n=1 Tax=Mesorhizobium sp. B2-4-17 TaxID=2589932 RepID=UPI00112C623F|nr:hypothetical protein [Mesorhizobium sp. B2-4-17]TPK85448.1 hypothetical protein FJ548_16605 [Mesorhizobium sp. B2-4-17]